MDRTRVFTLALKRLGDREYVEGSETAPHCEEWFEHVLRLANAKHNWTFCKKRVKLPVYDAAIFEYLLPADCLKVINVETMEHSKVRFFEILGRSIYTKYEENELLLTYISDLVAQGGTLPDSAPLFCQGVIDLLASYIAIPITGQPQLAESLRQSAELQFRAAITSDRQQDASNASSPINRILKENIWD